MPELKADELIQFLMWGEQIHRPRLFRLCEYFPAPSAPVPPDAPYSEYNPLLQTIGYNNQLLGNDSPGQAGIQALVEEFNDWQERLKIGKARELTTVIVEEDDNTGK